MAKLLIRLAKLDMSDRVFFWMYGLGSVTLISASVLIPLFDLKGLSSSFFADLRRFAFGS